ncbi:hypothetical protein [Pedobacter rhodius]|uniref:DUF4440 domain-containing protein n=1 Tax=Pedobacter rhodius TaxID=3004098 RepID=A0ABT4KY51_9SPHI|nr:hypothetical protein [Pedobacter sp. SJ11]MCZ4223860.1 hypothetical protein [Pedobacter sp. SJ11]
METDLIISAINELHKKANAALESRDATTYTSIFDESFTYTRADGIKLDKKDYSNDIERYFRRIKRMETSHYRIKSSFENEVFTEKIARKSIIIRSKLLLLSKKQTIQTEEIFHWKNIDNEWKVIAVEVVLEEKY